MNDRTWKDRTCPVTKAACAEGFRCGNFKGCIIDNLGALYYEQKRRDQLLGRIAQVGAALVVAYILATIV